MVRAQGAPSSSFGLGMLTVPGGEKRRAGQGLRFGRSVFHAGATLESGWDSNVFYGASGDVTSSAYLRLFPMLSLGTRPVAEGAHQSVVYDISLGLDYVAYLQDLGSDLSKRHHVGTSLGANVTFNPQGQWAFGLLEQFVRTNEPRVGVDGSADRDYNQVGFNLKYNPGKGLISFALGYRFVVDAYEQSQYAFANRMAHQVSFKADWRFFPKTSWWLKVDTGYTDYFRDFNEGAVGSTDGGNRNSVPLRVMLGATGRLTHWLTLDLGIGYGGAFYDGIEAADYHHDVVANIGAGIKLGPHAQLKFGYRHDFADSAVGDYFKSDSAYVRLNMAFFKRLVIGAMFAWTMADYKGYYLTDAAGPDCSAPDPSGASLCARRDHFLVTTVNADYYFLSWLSAGLAYTLTANVTDFDASYTGSAIPVAFTPSFMKHRVAAQVTLYY